MTQQDKEQMKLEIDHIFESGVNEIRIFEMVVNFIDSRNGVNKNFVLADVNGQLPLDFVKWYSGMEQEKILKAYERWEKESGNLR
jgi:hypothetical protein